jgi:hypothetical protein
VREPNEQDIRAAFGAVRHVLFMVKWYSAGWWSLAEESFQRVKRGFPQLQSFTFAVTGEEIRMLDETLFHGSEVNMQAFRDDRHMGFILFDPPRMIQGLQLVSGSQYVRMELEGEHMPNTIYHKVMHTLVSLGVFVYNLDGLAQAGPDPTGLAIIRETEYSPGFLACCSAEKAALLSTPCRRNIKIMEMEANGYTMHYGEVLPEILEWSLDGEEQMLDPFA